MKERPIRRFDHYRLALFTGLALCITHSAASQVLQPRDSIPTTLKDYVPCFFNLGSPAQAASRTPSSGQFLPPKDVLCSFSLLAFNEASDIFGKRIAKTYAVVQVVVRNLNQKNDFLLHDVLVRVPLPEGTAQDVNAQFRAGRDKLLARGVSIKGQSLDPRNLIMGSLDTLAATAGAISLIGAAATPVTAAFQDLSNGTNVLTAFLPPLKRLFPDYTVDQLNRLNDLGFSASSNYKIIVPKGGSIPFVTFVPQELFATRVKDWKTDDFVRYDNTTYVLVAGALIQELTSAPTIAKLDPVSGPPGTSITITGTNFGDTPGSNTFVKFDGIQLPHSSWSATSITAAVRSDASVGAHTIVVSVSNVDSASQMFTVTPTITSLLPPSGPVGTDVTISGTKFGSAPGDSTVKFGTVAATVGSWSDGSIHVTVPSVAAGPSEVVVTVNKAPSAAATFTVTSTPSITSVLPLTGPPGTQVTISGTNFGDVQGTSTVKFGESTAQVNSWSATSIAATVPALAAAATNVVVSVNNASSAGSAFTVTSLPTVTSLSPASAPPGSSITIIGTNFGAAQGSSTVKFGNAEAQVASWSAGSITATVPNLPVGRADVVLFNGANSTPATFTVTPSIASLSPALGASGAQVTINGTAFGDTQGTSTVKFENSVAPVTKWSATQITVTVPVLPAGTAHVTVTVNNTSSAAATFSINEP